MGSIQNWFNAVVRWLEICLISIFALLVLDVLIQVFSRYIFESSFSWTEEFARFSLIWMTMIGAAYLNAKREHLSMDFVFGKLTDIGKRRAAILIEVLIFIFALVVIVVGGSNLVFTTLHLGQVSGSLRIPLGYIYAILPFSGLLMMIFSSYHIFNIYTRKVNY